MIVPDASVTALLFADAPGRAGDHHDNHGDPRVAAAIRALRADPEWAVPEHWRIEVVSVIRGLVLGGKMSQNRAASAIAWLKEVQVLTASTRPLLTRMWNLRSNLTAYDAGYVATAEAYDLTLVTADRRIARAGVARCPVQTIT